VACRWMVLETFPGAPPRSALRGGKVFEVEAPAPYPFQLACRHGPPLLPRQVGPTSPLPVVFHFLDPCFRIGDQIDWVPRKNFVEVSRVGVEFWTWTGLALAPRPTYSVQK